MSRQDDEPDDFFYAADCVPPGPLGLLFCLSVGIAGEWFGCFICKRKQPAGSSMVWVSMDVKPGDTTASVFEACGEPKAHQAAW